MTFIPIEYYSLFYTQFLLIVVLIVFMGTLQTELTNSSSLRAKNTFGILLLAFIILYMGLRPISTFFGDMAIYNNRFNDYVNGAPIDANKDMLFEYMMFFFAKYLNAKIFFFTCAFIYVSCLYASTKKIFKEYWFYAFIMLVSAFTFWAYGVNGIRNGMATSLFMYGITRDKKAVTLFVLFCSYFVHSSLLIPITAYIVSLFYSNTKTYIICWVLAIPFSFVLGSVLEAFFLGLGFGDDKLDSYLGEFNQVNEGVEIRVGFRWDFIVYSATGIFAGWYYIIKKGFIDALYNKIFHTYLITNAFWVLIIRANYSNRFAYLSWFMLGLVLIYPLLKSQIVKDQHKFIGRIVFAFFAFSYFMIVILGK